MEIAIAPSRPISVTRYGRILFRVMLVAASLYVLCVVAPAIYFNSSALRSWDRGRIEFHTSLGRNLARLREAQRAVLVEADLKGPGEGSSFLNKEIVRAKIELQGCQSGLRKAQSALRDVDTLFNRTTGNKLLAVAELHVYEQEALTRLAAEYVRQLTSAAKRSGSP